MKKYIWVMSEERDEEFSKELYKKFEKFANSMGIIDFLIEIKEKYTTEDVPHYHLKIAPRDNPYTKTNSILASYSATANGITYKGLITITFMSSNSINNILAPIVFVYYHDFIQEFYPEWVTHYGTITYQ